MNGEENGESGGDESDGVGEKEKTPPPPPPPPPPPSEESADQPTRYVCAQCGAAFARKFNRDRHVRLLHNYITRVYDCSYCGAIFDTSKKLNDHRLEHSPTTGFEVKQSAFRKSCVIFRKSYKEKMLTLENAFTDDREDMRKLIEFEVGTRKSMKVGIIYHAEFSRIQPQMGGAMGDDDNFEQINEEEVEPDSPNEGEEMESVGEESGEEEIEQSDGEEPDEEEIIDLAEHASEEVYAICLRAPSVIVTTATNVKKIMQVARQQIQNRIDDFIENGSGWRLNAILFADIEIGNCSSLNGSCNLVSIEHLKSLKYTRNEEDTQTCFFHACAFHFVKSQDVVKLDRFIKRHFVTRVKSPVAVKDIAKFERDNSHLNLKINVIHLEEENLYPLIFSKKINAKYVITLLLYKTEVNGKVVSHYSHVCDVNKLLRKRYKYGNKYSYRKTISCLNCFSKFDCSYGNGENGKENLEKHYEHCSQNKPQAVRVPHKGAVIKFKNFVNKFESYFYGVFDFESRHVKQKYECAKCEKVSENDNVKCPHRTRVKAVQEPITCSYIIVNKHGHVVYTNTFTGLNCTQVFLQELIALEPELLATLSQYETLTMSVLDEQTFQDTTHCHICEESLEDEEDKVRDHCHITGDFLGAAHAACNLNRVVKKKIPMFCHNLTGYDGHFIMQHVGQIEGVTELKALPSNSERFRCITINSYELKDSASFLNASLNDLMNNLLQNKSHTFPIIDQLGLYGKHEVEKKKLILQKGIYPYEFCSSIAKLRRTHEIPAKEHFYSALTNTNVSDEDYAHSKKVLQVFGCKDMIDYTEIYCTVDSGILCEVVTQFRKTVLDNFGLEMCYYISTPQLAFDCMLRMTEVEIELLTDIDQILFIEQNIRGGVSYINQRHCVAETRGEDEIKMKFIDGECNFPNETKMSCYILFLFSKQPLWSRTKLTHACKRFSLAG